MAINRVRLVAVCLLMLVAAAPAVAQQLVPVKVFASPDPSGFITQESKSRQYRADELVKALAKQKKNKQVVTVRPDAAISLEILSFEQSPTGTVETYDAQPVLGAQPIIKTRPILQNKIRAVLRFGDFTQEFVETVNPSGKETVESKLIWRLESWVKDNAAKLKQ